VNPVYTMPITGLTAPQKLKHLILLEQLNLCAMEAYDGDEMTLSVSRLEAADFKEVSADTIDAFYQRMNCDKEAIHNVRSTWVFETGIEASDTEDCLASSVGRAYLDGSYIGWTFWITRNGRQTGDYGPEQRMPWIDQAYDLKCVRTFSKVEADHG
jgi:hypothetical protein